MSEAVGLHYQLIAYVCGASCVQDSPFEGWATFEQIFQRRPDNCRYAVARQIPLQMGDDGRVDYGSPQGEYLCWDLYDDSLLTPSGFKKQSIPLKPPRPLWVTTSPDGLIMKAMALYERV